MNNEAQEPLEIESSAILDPVGSNQFWSCPTAMVVVKVVPYPLPSCFNSYFSSSVLCHYGVSTALSHNKDVNLASICDSAYHSVRRQEWIKDGKLDGEKGEERKKREGGREGGRGSEGCVDAGNSHKPASHVGDFNLLLRLPELLVA